MDGKQEPGRVVHRAALLKALLAPIPQAMQHVNKKLSSISQHQENVELIFEDGTKEVFQAVIGADGIFGSVRRHVLQGSADEHQATPAGFWDCRYLVPIEKAREKLGKEYFEEHRQYGWCGDGAFIMHDVLDNGSTVQCVVSAVEKERPKDRSRPLTREILQTTLRNWLDGPIANNMMDVSPGTLFNTYMCTNDMPSFSSRVKILRCIPNGSTNRHRPMPMGRCVLWETRLTLLRHGRGAARRWLWKMPWS